MRIVCASITALILLTLGLPSAMGQPLGGDDDWIVVLTPGADATAQAGRLAESVNGRVGHIYEHVVGGFSFHGSSRAAAALERNRIVRAVVPDGSVQLADNAGLGIFRIDAHLSQATAYGRYRGAGSRIAVLDSGVDVDHPDLAPNLDLANAINCDDSSSTIDDLNSHGSHVAGIAAAANNGIGLAGVAAEAEILALKAFDATGFANDSELLCAMNHLASVVVAQPMPTVLNMSFVDSGVNSVCDDADVTDVMHEAVCDLDDLGVIMVAGAGNSAINVANQVPATWDETIAVSSFTDFDGAAGGADGCYIDLSFGFECDDTFSGSFSNHGARIDVMAPGVEIQSTIPGGLYEPKSGTSMATPHVSGVVAIMLAADPTLTRAEILTILLQTGECPDGSVNTDGSTCAGSGTWPDDPDGIPEPLVNALRAAQTADADGPINQPPTAAFTESCSDLNCAFTDTSTDPDGTLASWSWDFGDGTTSTLENPTHTYATGGTYNVAHTVTDDDGVTGTTSHPVTVDVTPDNQAPTASAGPDQQVPDVRKKGVEPVTLDGTSSTDPDGTITSYSWSDDGGEVASGAAPTIVLPVGVNVLTLTVTDDDGATDTDLVVVTVGDATPPANEAPVADAGADQTVFGDPLNGGAASVALDGTGSSDPDGTITSYAWTDAGGTTLAVGASAVVTLPVGTNEVTLTVTDDDGATDTDLVVVTVDLVGSEPIHVHEFTGAAGPPGRGGRWSASADVYVTWSNLEPLLELGADPTTVSISASTGQTLTCTTAASADQTTDGRCSVTLTDIGRKIDSVTLTIVDVSAPGFAYIPGDNHVPTTITILKP